MKLILESQKLADYLTEVPNIIEFYTPLVHQKVKWIKAQTNEPIKQAELAFELARDEIQHSFDIESKAVSISAEETLNSCEGICFAKAHLLATLLRAMQIPCGFCYQRVLRKGTLESGYALHGLNAVYLPKIGWFRLDPRGNKKGVDSQFSIVSEKLAYPIREELGEIDYPNVFTKPLDSVIQSMLNSTSTKELFFNRPSNI